MVFPVLDILTTMRCNASCKNCIEFCNMQDRTGLDYSNLEITLEQVAGMVREVRDMATHTSIRPIISKLSLSGGECTLHPQLNEIIKLCKPLLVDKLVDNLYVSTNLVNPVPDKWKELVANISLPKDNWKIHNTVFVYPTKPFSYFDCDHHRKYHTVFSCYGYFICCAGDSYARLYCLDELFLPRIPGNPYDFDEEFYLATYPDVANAVKNKSFESGYYHYLVNGRWECRKQNKNHNPFLMDLICRHCPFGGKEFNPTKNFERDMGSPMSEEYITEALKNKAGRKITKRYVPPL